MVIDKVKANNLWRLFWKMPRQWGGGMVVIPQRLPLVEIKTYLEINNLELEYGELDVLLSMDVVFVNKYFEQQEK